MNIYNSLSKKIEDFKPIAPPHVGMYTCGPTVYDYVHIGNFRTYTTADFLLRTLKFFGYDVNYIMNITDVGHLTGDNLGDADTGEDRMEKASKKEGRSAWDIAKYYETIFKEDYAKLNLIPPKLWTRATDYIQEQIGLVKTLEEKGFTYKTSDGIYFDTSKFPDYGKLSPLDLSGIKEGARVAKNEEKKNPSDFALWKFSPKDTTRQMEWDSPWGIGFPGWHIECSAMSMKYLGETFDIHAGGEDLAATHHPNEIAQSEAATGKRFVNYWVHGAFMMVDGGRMSKSLGNNFRLKDIIERGFDPMDLRYLYLQTHYRQKMNFTWDSLTAAQNARKNLVSLLSRYREAGDTRSALSEEKLAKVDSYQKKFSDTLSDDLNMPQTLAVVWEVMKSNIPSLDKYDLLVSFDEVLGLGFQRAESREQRAEIPEEIQQLVQKREMLRKEKKWEESDVVRRELEDKGYKIKDTPQGAKIEQTNPPNRRTRKKKNGVICLFGSGEISTTGRKIHEHLFESLGIIPVNVSIVATPAGFQSNAYNVARDISDFLQTGLQNYKPAIDIIPAFFKVHQPNRYTPSGGLNTDDEDVVKRLSASDYIFVGPGSPTYALSELLGSKTYEQMVQSQREGAVLSMASAAAIAFSNYVLPVYEIYKAGLPLEWKSGLNFFEQFGLNLTIVSHWNNNEGGAKHDTSRCYMGKERFEKLLTLLPGETTIVGIDEHTALIFDPEKGEGRVMGVGEVTIVGKKLSRVHTGETISIDRLR